MRELTIDFETRSFVNLKKTNVSYYFAHPSTQVLICSITPERGKPWLWASGDPFPFEDDDFFFAYNLEFETEAWEWCHRNLDWPELPSLDRFECLRARANYDGLPRNLDQVGKSLGLGAMGKDMDGHRIMMRLSKPQCKGKQEEIGPIYQYGEFDEDPEKHAANGRYCLQDGMVERLVKNSTEPLIPRERELFAVHHAINKRGIPVDVDLCNNANRILELERERLGAEMMEVTGDAVTTPDQLPAMKDWIKDRMGLEPNRKVSLTADTIPQLIANPKVPDDVKRALEIRLEARDAAVAKYQAVLNHTLDGRCRNQHLFYQAGTGRFQTAGVNFGNLRRLNEDLVPEQLKLCDRISDAATHDEIVEIWQELIAEPGGSVVNKLGSPIRMTMRAPKGRKLTVCDLSAIEMRGLWWAAGDWVRMDQLKEFDAGRGIEPYKMTAMTFLNIPLDAVGKKERNVGKGIELGAGYVSGAATIQAFLKIYGVDIDLSTAEEWKQLYRREHPHVKRYWYRLQDAAHDAIKQPGREFTVGPITCYYKRQRLNMRLPSGRELRYYDPVIIDGRYGPEIECENIQKKGGRRRWVTMPTLVENSIQAICRDLLTESMIKAHEAGLEIVLTVYDEIVIECDENDDDSPKVLQQIMEDAPDWAVRFPISTSLGSSHRYTK